MIRNKFHTLQAHKFTRSPSITAMAETDPFEDENGTYFALINDEGQYSLWQNISTCQLVRPPSMDPLADKPVWTTSASTGLDARPRSLIETGEERQRTDFKKPKPADSVWLHHVLRQALGEISAQEHGSP